MFRGTRQPRTYAVWTRVLLRLHSTLGRQTRVLSKKMSLRWLKSGRPRSGPATPPTNLRHAGEMWICRSRLSVCRTPYCADTPFSGLCLQTRLLSQPRLLPDGQPGTAGGPRDRRVRVATRGHLSARLRSCVVAEGRHGGPRVRRGAQESDRRTGDTDRFAGNGDASATDPLREAGKVSSRPDRHVARRCSTTGVKIPTEIKHVPPTVT